MSIRRLALATLAYSSLALLAPMAQAASVGQKAPDWTLQDLSGNPVNLKQFEGKWVVLEWTNPGCPFVQKHYKSGNMQETQMYAAGKKVSWIQVNSTSPGHPDYMPAGQMMAWNTAMRAMPAKATLDETGKTGKAYGAKTTPQIVMISPDGKVVYNGAIDSVRSANPADIQSATNYAKQAIDEVLAGKPVSVPETTPYGCSVKY